MENENQTANKGLQKPVGFVRGLARGLLLTVCFPFGLLYATILAQSPMSKSNIIGPQLVGWIVLLAANWLSVYGTLGYVSGLIPLQHRNDVVKAWLSVLALLCFSTLSAHRAILYLSGELTPLNLWELLAPFSLMMHALTLAILPLTFFCGLLFAAIALISMMILGLRSRTWLSLFQSKARN